MHSGRTYLNAFLALGRLGSCGFVLHGFLDIFVRQTKETEKTTQEKPIEGRITSKQDPLCLDLDTHK
jgi:hypothetical protein